MPLNRKRARKVMEKHGLDALISTLPENNTYVSDIPLLHAALSDTRIFVLLGLEKDIEPAIILPSVVLDLWAQSDSWVEDVRLYSPFHYFKEDKLDAASLSKVERRIAEIYFKKVPEQGGIDALVQVLEERGIAEGRLGLDEKNLSSPREHEETKKALPKAEIIDAYKIFQEIRMVKTPEEIRRIREATRITEKGMMTAMDMAKIGMTEKELEDIFRSTVQKEGAKVTLATIGAGTRGAICNCIPSDYALKNGDAIRFDLYSEYQYYHSDVARVAVLGKPTDKLKKYQNAVVQGVEAAEDAVKPGIRAYELGDICVETVRKCGIPHFDRRHCGHGIGIESYDPPLIASSPAYRQRGDIPLEAGMVLNIEAPYYELGFGCTHMEDTILVTKDGFERIQKIENQLYEL